MTTLFRSALSANPVAMTLLSKILHRLLEVITIGLLVILATLVVAAVVARYVLNSSLPWYDETASVLLAWITYYGAALAALRRAHLGFSGFVLGLGRTGRIVCFVLSELVVYAVFVSMAYAGWYVLRIMEGETLVSLDWVPLMFTQSVVPIGCGLFVICHLLSTPGAWRRTLLGRSAEEDEIAQEISKAESERDALAGPKS